MPWCWNKDIDRLPARVGYSVVLYWYPEMGAMAWKKWAIRETMNPPLAHPRTYAKSLSRKLCLFVRLVIICSKDPSSSILKSRALPQQYLVFQLNIAPSGLTRTNLLNDIVFGKDKNEILLRIWNCFSKSIIQNNPTTNKSLSSLQTFLRWSK